MPPGMLRDVPRQAGDLRAQLRERAPARRAQLRLGIGQRGELVADARRVPAVGDPREPLEVGERQPERLADVADRAARAIRRERRDERRVLAPVLLGHADDQLLADVAGKVEVDVRHRRQLVVEEAAEREVGRDGIDVREAGQVADDRADGRAAAAPGRQHLPRDRRAAHLDRDLARELEHLPVQEEEPGEPEPLDQRELLVEASPSAALVTVSPTRSVRGTGGRRARAAARSPAPRRRRSRDSGSRAPPSDRTRAAARARPCARRLRGRRGTARASRRPRPAPTRGCRAARARSRRATCGCGSRRARPAGRRANDAWACGSPVTTVATPSVSARSRSAALRRTSPRS